MTSQAPLSVEVTRRTSHVVVDALLALSPWGLLATMRLAQAAHVWLPQGLRDLLDGSALYRKAPGRLGLGWLPSETRAPLLARMAEALTPWHRAWSYGRLPAQVHWVGDAQHECLLADRGDLSLLPRLIAFGAALDSGTSPCAYDDPLDRCGRDAVALAAALQPEPVAIVTLGAGAPGSPPPACAWLAGAGIPSRPIAAGPGSALVGDLGIAEALRPLVAGGLSLAVLHLLAPEALAAPDGWGDGDWDSCAPEDDPAHRAAWTNALVLWHALEAEG